MANINSRTIGHRTRQDMAGKLADHLGVTFSFVDGKPTLRLAMVAPGGRDWCLTLDAAETARLFAGCDQVRTIKDGNRLVLPVKDIPDGDGWSLVTGNAFQNVWEREVRRQDTHTQMEAAQ